MFRTKKTKSVLATLFSKIKNTVSLEDYKFQEYWRWDLGHEKQSLPFASMPRTIKAILKLDLSLLNKLREINTAVIQPIFRREISWSFGGLGDRQYHWFDWLTLKQGYSYTWHVGGGYMEDHFHLTKTCEYEKSIFEKDYRLISTECRDNSWCKGKIITEEKYDALHDAYIAEQEEYYHEYR